MKKRMSESKVFFLVSSVQIKGLSVDHSNWGLYKHLKHAREMQRRLSDQEIYDQVIISPLEVLDEETQDQQS